MPEPETQMKIRRHTNNYIALIEDDEDNDNKIMLCENCASVGRQSILKPRLYFTLDNGKQVVREPDSDYNDWRQCRICWSVVKVSETKVESELTDVVEVDDSNIKEEVQPIFTKKRKGRLQQVLEQNTKNKIKDEDVLKAIKQGKKVTRYEEFQTGE